MVEEFIKRKHGKEEIVYPHPLLEPILSETYGVIVYQEQVMQIAQVLAGYSLGDADNLRRAMGKKKTGGDGQGARALHRRARSSRASPTSSPASIFDQMETFAAYGFNKSPLAPPTR